VRAGAPPRPLLAVPNVTAHPPTTRVLTSMWHYTIIASERVKGHRHLRRKQTWLLAASSCIRPADFFRDVLSKGKHLRCVALRYGMMETTL